MIKQASGQRPKWGWRYRIDKHENPLMIGLLGLSKNALTVGEVKSNYRKGKK